MTAELKSRIADEMPVARRELAELVAFRSVADAAVESPDECAHAAEWVVDAFRRVGVADAAAHATPDGSKVVIGDDPGSGRRADGSALQPLRRPTRRRRIEVDESTV